MEFNLADTIKGKYGLVKPLDAAEINLAWLALDEVTKQNVMVRAIPSSLNRVSLTRQATMINEHPHPNLARLLDIGEKGRIPYTIIEYVNGPAISKKLKNEFSPELFAQYFKQAISALACLHEMGIVHGNIKSDTIYIDAFDKQLKLTAYFKVDPSHTLTSLDDLQNLASIFQKISASHIIDQALEALLIAITSNKSVPYKNAQAVLSILNNKTIDIKDNGLIDNKELLKANPFSHEKEFEDNSKLIKTFAISALVVCILIVAITFYTKIDRTPEVVTPRAKIVATPNLVGLTLSDAEALAKKDKLVIAVGSVEKADNIPANTIRTQDPKAMMDIQTGDTIIVGITPEK